MAYAPNSTAGNGSVTDFGVTFPYLRQAHVKVTVAGVEVSKTWVNSGTIRVSPAPGNGVAVVVYRDTPAVPLATLQNNKPVPAATYNDLVKQAIYFSEERAYEVLTAVEPAVDGLEDLDAAIAAVEADRVAVAADKATVAADKATTVSAKNDALAAAIDAANQAYLASTYVGSASSLNGQPASYYLDRTNHTGTQAIASVSGLQTALDGKAAASHAHTIANVTALQTALDGKAALADGSQALAQDGTDTTQRTWRATDLKDAAQRHGASVVIASGSASGASQLDLVLSTYLALGYRDFELEFHNYIPSSDNSMFSLRVSTNGGSSFLTTAYRWAWFVIGVSNFQNGNNSAADILLVAQAGNGTSEQASGTVRFRCGPAKFSARCVHEYLEQAGNQYIGISGGSRNSANVNAIRLYPSAGTMSFDYTLRAIKSS